MPRIILIIHNVRSAYNVGSLLRTADALGISKVYFSGFSPYPEAPRDRRLPHVRARATSQIHKTALGAEKMLAWQYVTDISSLLQRLGRKNYLVAALEQSPKSQTLQSYRTERDVALILGNEVTGLEADVLKHADVYLEIPMLGNKESLNVVVAAGIALYHLRYHA
ncbi:MAG: TrmH family RNA methyltransferase [Candidatus Saccharimonadales bacterium]|jgi:tRNA G18 (ribose-2'-O)-methylase SpoU